MSTVVCQISDMLYSKVNFMTETDNFCKCHTTRGQQYRQNFPRSVDFLKLNEPFFHDGHGLMGYICRKNKSSCFKYISSIKKQNSQLSSERAIPASIFVEWPTSMQGHCSSENRCFSFRWWKVSLRYQPWVVWCYIHANLEHQ